MPPVVQREARTWSRCRAKPRPEIRRRLNAVPETPNLPQNGTHDLFHIFACGLPTFHIDVHATVEALVIEQVAQSQQRRGLARLPGRMQDEVAFVADESVRDIGSARSTRSKGGIQ